MALDLRQLRYFVAVAEAQHFGRAAERLNVAQPALSMQVAALERHLGARLLDRAHRRVALTEAGSLLLAEARAALRQVERAERVTRQAGRGESGVVAFGYTGSAPYNPAAAELLRRARVADPGIELRLSQTPAAAQVDGLARGEIDLGLLRSPLPPMPKELDVLALADEPLVLALPSSHPLAAPEEVELAKLAGDPFVSYASQGGAGLFGLVRDACHAAGFAPAVAQTVPQVGTIVCLVAAGLGVALVPESVGRLSLPGVLFRPLRDPPRTALLMIHRRDERSPAVRTLLRHGREVASDKLP